MKYKFKSNYIYQYFLDDKGSQGRITYTKGDVVQGDINADKIKINITPVKVYDIITKKYITLNSIDVRSSFLEEISGQSNNTTTTDGMVNSNIKKYKVIANFKLQIDDKREREVVHPAVMPYYKIGDIVYGNPSIRVAMQAKLDHDNIRYQQPNPNDKNMMLISQDGNFPNSYKQYAPISALQEITSGKSEVKDNLDLKEESQPEKSKSKLFTTNNILIGLAVIAVIGIGYYIINK
jgi:hypothetical protein